MTPDLPKPIQAYFAADGRGEDAADCFAADAVVIDEGHTHRGRASIRQWKAGVAAKFRYTIEPLSVEREDGATIVTCRITGDFPGSPVDLRHIFRLRGDSIACLEIVP